MVIGHATPSTVNYGECCHSVALFRRTGRLRSHHAIATATISPSPLARRLDPMEDRPLQKSQKGRCAMQSKAQIDQVLRQKSDAREIPGVVAMAANSKEPIYQGAFGKRDLSKDDAMTLDSVFWIASMTKAITAAGAMQLVEQGKLSLDTPIST